MIKESEQKMNRNLMSVARKALTKAYNPNSLTITDKLFFAGLSLSLSPMF